MNADLELTKMPVPVHAGLTDTRHRILFVDDEPNVLEGLRRMLRHQRDHWDITFAHSGDEALAMLAQTPADVIVSDLRMPGMDGIALLHQVRERSPETVRIALSGYSDKLESLRAVSHIHQFLAKPCDAEALCATLERALHLSALLRDERIRRLVSSFSVLPSIENVYHEVLSELASPVASARTVGLLLARDPGMSTKVLQLVNSPLVGLNRLVSDPVHATALLGLDTMSSLVLTVRIFQLFEAGGSAQAEAIRVWDHSVRVAHFARRIADEETGDAFTAECAFLAGLFHDIGKVILAVNLPDKYGAVSRLTAAHAPSRSRVEPRIFGATHGEVGAFLIGLWGFSEPIIEAVAQHHQPNKAPAAGFNALAALHIANGLVHWNESGATAPLYDFLNRDYLETLGQLTKTSRWREILQSMDTGDSTHD
jgi:putative nucleotidyltransferase with HDIG domain